MATDERAGAEIVHGKEACERFSVDLMKELGFPSGVLPMGELEECGRVRSSGLVWWKCKAPYELFNVALDTKTSYAIETTAYVEKGKIKKINGWKAKTLVVWVSIAEIYVEGDKITFKSSLGKGKSFPLVSFMNEEEKKAHLK